MMGQNGSDRAVLARGLCCLVLTAAAAALVSLPTPHRAIAAGADCRRRGARRRAIVAGTADDQVVGHLHFGAQRLQQNRLQFQCTREVDFSRSYKRDHHRIAAGPTTIIRQAFQNSQNHSVLHLIFFFNISQQLYSSNQITKKEPKSDDQNLTYLQFVWP